MTNYILLAVRSWDVDEIIQNRDTASSKSSRRRGGVAIETDRDVHALSSEEIATVKHNDQFDPVYFDFGSGAKLVIENDFNQETFKKLMGVLVSCNGEIIISECQLYELERDNTIFNECVD